MRHRFAAGILALAFVALASSPAHAQNFNNTDNLSRWATTGPFPANIGVGQVVQTNAANPYLNNFSFWIGGGPTPYQAFIVSLTATSFSTVWSSQILNQPTPVIVPPNSAGYSNSLSVYQQVTIPVGILLNPGAVYAAYLTPTLPGGPGMSMAHGQQPNPTGTFSNQDLWVAIDFSNNTWASSSQLQTAFAANYCASASACVSVPEPGTAALMLTALLGMVFVGKRRKQGVSLA